jgi:hypothetical protein
MDANALSKARVFAIAEPARKAYNPGSDRGQG